VALLIRWLRRRRRICCCAASLRAFHDRPWRSATASEAVSKWISWNECWLCFAMRYPTAALTVGYEELLNDAALPLSGIARGLGVVADDEWLTACGRQVRRPNSDEGERLRDGIAPELVDRAMTIYDKLQRCAAVTGPSAGLPSQVRVAR